MPDAFPILQPQAPKRKISLTSLILVPLKQHLGCCVIAPALIKTVGSVSLIGSIMAVSDRFHIYLTLGIAPVVVWLCLWLEDRFHDWQHRRGHFAAAGKMHAHDHAAHGHVCHSCEPCPVDHSRPGLRRRFLLNLAIAYAVILVIELFHHHTR